MMFCLISTNIHKAKMLQCVPFNIVFGHSAILPHDAFLITRYIHKSMMLLCVPFNVLFPNFAILPDDVLFDHKVHSQVYDAAMHAI